MASILRSICRISKAAGCRGLATMSTEAASASIWPRHPWLMLPPSVQGTSISNHNFYSLKDNSVISIDGGVVGDSSAVTVGSSHGWLTTYERGTRDMFLWNPLTRRRLKLPSIGTLPLTQVRGRKYRAIPSKIVLNSCSPDADEDCRAVMTCGPHDRLAACCPRASGAEWAPFGDHLHENGSPRVYADLVCWKHNLFCVTSHYLDFECWDLSDPKSAPKLTWKVAEKDLRPDPRNYPFAAATEKEFEIKRQCLRFKYIVVAEKTNELFVVSRSVVEQVAPDGSYIFRGGRRGDNNDFLPHKTVAFEVHKVDPEKGELRYMNGSLDGMVLFVGSSSHSFAIEDPDVIRDLDLKPNSIYFTDTKELIPPPWGKERSYGGHDIGIFDYSTKAFSPCYYPDTVTRIAPAPIWFTPSPYPSPRFRFATKLQLISS